MEVYLLHTKVCDWRIEQALGGSQWILKRRPGDPTLVRDWVPVAIFGTARQAADAVADGRTGEPDWDGSVRSGRRSDYELQSWVRYNSA